MQLHWLSIYGAFTNSFCHVSDTSVVVNGEFGKDNLMDK